MRLFFWILSGQFANSIRQKKKYHAFSLTLPSIICCAYNKVFWGIFEQAVLNSECVPCRNELNYWLMSWLCQSYKIQYSFSYKTTLCYEKSGPINGMVSLEGDNLIVFYDFSASAIWPLVGGALSEGTTVYFCMMIFVYILNVKYVYEKVEDMPSLFLFYVDRLKMRQFYTIFVLWAMTYWNKMVLSLKNYWKLRRKSSRWKNQHCPWWQDVCWTCELSLVELSWSWRRWK